MPSLWVTGADGVLHPLEIEGYATERDFQTLLADNPAVLAGALGGEADEAWLLVTQELPIKATESDVGTWRLDHLFVASDGTPVLVEVKRSRDPRARREVVAQMLDYAASFQEEWPSERLRARRQDLLTTAKGSADAELDSVLAAGGFDDEEQLWAAVQEKIDNGKLRLLFVADQLSPTLIRIIEFLNRQLRSVEILGIEVLRHASPTSPGVAYQPVVRGRSSPEAQRKAPVQRRSREEFNEVLLAHHPKEVLAAVDRLMKRAVTELGAFESVSTSEADPALYVNFHATGGPVYWPLLLRPKRNKLVVRITKLRTHPAFADDSVRDDLMARIAAATGVAMQGNPDGAPWVPLTIVADSGVVDNLVEVLRWVKGVADGVQQ